MLNEHPLAGASLRGRSTRPMATVLAAGVAVGSVLLLGGGADAQELPPFDGTASGYAFVLQVANPETIPLGITPEADGPTAQSRLSSIQQSDSFAAAPYFGEAITGIPGLAGSLVGVPLPPYPLIVSTGFGDAPAEKSFGAVSLQATSDLLASTAQAVAGDGAAGSSSRTRVAVAADQGVTAEAVTRVGGIELSGLLDIGSVRSVVTAVRDPAGTLKTSSTLTVVGVTVPALRLPVPDCTPSLPVPVDLPTYCLSSVPLPGGLAGKVLVAPSLSFEDGTVTVTTAPQAGVGPVSFEVPLQDALDALAAAGVDATYSAPRSLTGQEGKVNGISGAVLTLTTRLPPPPPPVDQQVQGPTTATLILGRSTAQVDYSVVAELPADGGLLLPPDTLAPAVPDGAGPPALDVPPATGGSLVDGLPVDLAPVVAGAQPIAGLAPTVATAPAAFGRPLVLPDVRDIYLAVAAAAVLVWLSSSMLRHGGVRS